ncbi:MAG: hypothetical protein J0H73_11590, partial [Salana multivorans]|nr:hypothetical protein [Salana multivorans]
MSDPLATSFGRAARTYEAGRPSYPEAAVAWLLGGPERPRPRVLDVGAGTGKLTRAVLASGAEVVAVDPDGISLLANLAVSPASRGLGVGARLMSHLAEVWAARAG